MNVQKGFTLIELLVVMAILALVVSIAIPSYNSSVVKTGRSDAKISLTSSSQLMEQCFSQTNKYNDAQCVSLIGTGIPSKEGLYKLTFVSSPSATTFALQAVPVAGKKQTSDKVCAKFSLNNLGQKTAIDSAGQISTKICW